MIESLELEDWKSHSRSSFSFAKGTNVLVGRMGSGKSSVLDALCFALYGTFPKMSRRDQSTETVVNLRSGAEYASVRLVFEKGGKRYEVARRIGKKISEAEIREAGKLLQKGAKPVTDLVVDILGVDYELFTRAIYSEQNRMDQLLSLSPRGRKQEIDWLLGLGRFDSARESAQSAAGKLSEQADALKMEADPERIRQVGESLERQKISAQEAAASCGLLLKKNEELALLHKEKTLELACLEKTRLEWLRKKRECDLLNGAVQRLSKESEGKTRISRVEVLQIASGLKENEGGLLAAKGNAKLLRGAFLAAGNELAVLQSEAKGASERKARRVALEKKAASLSNGRGAPQLESELALLASEAEALSSGRSRLAAEIEELEAAIGALSFASAKCPVCDSDLPDGKQEEISRAKKSAMESKKAELGAKSKLLNEKKYAAAGLEKALSEIRMCNAEADGLKGEGTGESELGALLPASIGKKAALEAEMKKAEEDIAGLEARLDAARRMLGDAERLERLFFDYDAARERLEKAEGELSALFFSEENYEAVRKGAESLSIECARAKSELLGEERRQSLVLEMCAVLERELAEKMGKEALSRKLASAAESMAIYKNALSSAQAELRADLVEEINEALSEIWPAVYPYSDYDAVSLEAGEKDYRLMMRKEGWKEVDAIASGGERACLCLALRVAFATVLTPDVGWLILDEPTHNLDSDAVSLLSEAINHKIPSIVEQTFVITHEPALGETSEGVVFRLERDKAAGESTIVMPQT